MDGGRNEKKTDTQHAFSDLRFLISLSVFVGRSYSGCACFWRIFECLRPGATDEICRKFTQTAGPKGRFQPVVKIFGCKRTARKVATASH